MLKLNTKKITGTKTKVSVALAKARAAGKALKTGRLKPTLSLAEVNKRFDFGGGVMSSEHWDMARDGVSVSSVSVWLQCREQFRLKYVEGWEGGSYSFPMEFGQVFHWLHEQWVSGKLSANLSKALAAYGKEWVRNNPTSTPQAREQQEVGYAMAAAVWPAYAEKYFGDRDRHWVTMEARFDVRFGDHKVKGYMDGVWEDDGLWLHEMKTKSRIDPGQIEETLWLDLQAMTYLNVLRLQYPEKRVAGIQYDVIRRSGILPKKDEPLNAYTARLAKEVARDPAHYFTRVNLPVEEAHVDAFRDTVLVPVLHEMSEWAAGNRGHYPTPDALVGKYGPCDMYQAIANHNYTGLRRKSCDSGRKAKAS
jgi:hypothetical protein